MENLKDNKLFIKAYILLVATIVLYYCSECSPLYLTNFWTDANVYFTIGRGMREGMVPYLDLYDHKGPIIYFLHMLAAYINPSSFIGMWFIEIIAAFIFFYGSYKLLNIFCKKYVLIYIPLLALFIYCSNTFAAGDSAEELCLPILAYCFFVGIKALKNKTLPDKLEAILLGLGATYVFWLKFTMAGFFLGFTIAFGIYSIKNNMVKNYWQTCALGLISFCGASLLVILIFALFGGAQALLQVYFIDNIFTYNEAKGIGLLLDNLKTGVFSYTYYYRYGFIMALLGWHYLFNYESKEMAYFSLWTFVCLFLTSYSGGRSYNYYSFIFSLYMPLAFCFVDVFLSKYINKNINLNNFYAVAVGILLCLLSNPFSYNKALRDITSDNYYLEPFARIICKEKNPTLINYKVMDLGLYNYCGVVPKYKYFSVTNIRKQKIFDGIKEYIEEGKVDFVFAMGRYSFEGYECILEKPYNDYGDRTVLCLYKKKY